MQQPKCSLFPAADKGLSGPRRVFWLLLIWLIVGIVIAPGILAQKEQQIPISLGDLIDGFETPAMGGFIEVPGEVEILTFNAEAGERIFLDWGFRDRSLDTLNIRFEGPSSKVYFDALMASPVASGVIQVVRTGLHQLVIGHPESTQIGHYTLRIHRVSEPEFFPMPFAIPTSDAGLGTGAGWIESPGAVDAYTFDSLADQSYILDFLSWDSNLEQINWAMLHEDASGVVGEILSGDLGSFEKRFINLQKEGAYRLQVGDSVDSGTGSYAFVFQAVPEPDFFELDLGEEVHIAADANGQGNLEMEAASDVFTWSQEQPGRFFFELVGFDSSLQSAQMRLIGPSGEQDVRFSRFFFGGDPGAFTLEEPGDYRLVIGGNLNSGVGRYELRIKPVPEDEEHLLSIGQAIDGTSATGEGFIPAPGARDVYLFDAQARQRVFFEPLSVSETLGLMTWTLEDPMGNLLFSQCMRCSVPPAMVLKQTGRYRLTVGGFQFAGTGAYSFRVAEIPAPKTYDIEGNQVTVSLDQPQPGAGRLELPGEVDLYRIPLRQGESCHLKLTELSRDLKWKLTDPAGMTVFDSSTDDLSPLDQFFGAERAGDHYLQVFQISANPVNYAFDCQILAACSVLDSETASALPTISFLDYVDGGGVSSPVIQLAGTVGWEGAARQRELVLVMDSSDSLAAYDPEQERMLAVRSLIEALPDEAPMRLALVDFDHEARLLQPLTEDWSEVIEHLSEFDASGGTDLELALNVALDEIIQNGREQATASIILFSDGETSEGNPSAAAQRAQGMGVEIHTVFLGREEVQRARLMETISLATCGNHRKALQASELSDIFRNLTNDVPIDRIQVLSSAQPNSSFAGQISGPFWRVEGIPVRAIQDQETELTVLMFTQESSPRIIESKIRLQYGQVSNQAPSMELVSVFESFEDQPAILSLALTDAEDADFDPDLEVSFSRPDWVDPDQGYDLSYQEGRLNLSWHPAADRFGQSLITLSATDSQGARVEQTLRWDLLPVNDPPYLETPEPITVLPGQPILPIGLFGISNGSEYENQQLSFVVSVKDESIMDPPDILYRPGASEGYLVLNHRPGVYGKTLVTITIRDGATTDATYTVQFPVQFQSPENQQPTLQWVRPAANASFLEGESIELEVKAEDADGIVAEILYQANGTQLGAGDPLTGRLAWMPTEPGIYVVEVQAVDDLGSVSEVLSRTLEVKVTPNEPPSMEHVSVFESLEDQPSTLSLALTDAEDADFDPDLEVTFSRPDWVDPDQGYELSYQEGRLNLSWHPAADRFGQSLITLSATDSQGARVEQTLRWDLLPVNDPPFLETPEPITVLPGQPILPIGLFGISNGSAYENQPLSFVVGVEDESIMDPPDILYRPGESEGTLLLNHRPGAYGTTLVTITIDDGATTDATYTVQFPVQFQSPENQKPTLQWVRPAANASFLEGESIELEVKAEDADGFVAEILYQANGTPLGAGDPLTGRLAWMPTEPGIYVVEVQAVDDLGSVSEVLSRTLEVKVTPNEPPSLRWVNPSQSLTTMWLGESLKLEVAAEDQDGTIALLEFLVDEEVIASQTSGSHEWVWRPQEAGDHIIQARVQDDDGAQSVSLLRTVKVVPRPAPFSLEITHPSDLDVVCLGEPIQVELALKGSPPSGVVVHLFAGNELVALRSASPYTFDWTPTLPGDLMLQAVAYLDDGSQVSSSAVRLGVSKTCYQAGILVGTNPVADPEWIKSILFEMGVGSVQVATPSESPEAWGEVDLVIAIEDGVTGIQEQTVLDLEYLHHELKLPVFLMGNHLLQSDPAMEEALLHRWRSLIHLEGEGVLSIEGLSELSETGFFQAILAGRFGKVAPFKLSGDMDWAVATEGAEAIVRVEDVDGMVRFPAGGASLEERPRWVTQNFSLISQLGIENDRSRRALFQNAVAWLIGDSVCSNAQFPVQVKAWQDESVAGQWVEQRLDLANFGACELTGGMLWIDYPSAIELDRVDLSMGLGWGLGVDGHSAFVQLGRLAGGGSVKAEVSLWMRGLEPGWHEVRFCSESNNTQEACVSQFWLVSGDSLVPASIRMQMAEDGRLWLRVEGASGVNYQIEVSYDLSHWMPFAEVEGTLTDLPLESLIQAGHPSAYFRLVHP